ncbi:deoxyribose-phosphate aldolase [Sporomusa sphaeroides]|uniref:Deoxyribose-phosphate aldolase n=1 Tax=Sporomusa sphaeroides DSM 2875 TaxID=1337886 RepID=A0ABP2C8M1_9FIRM|nr:deoxyribose-phosphate aldolase [Sporomusa sphaeroides]OLS54409.1 deoxyribose-phosphate aldolase [Sporomusa sphaeroides DSM 2875]CVK20652.1 Deoxyribose-phosphate aldolase [Sporomusa sphaeroides DSM 2875]
MNLAKYIDHTLLKPAATVEEIIRLCEEAAQHKFAAVCVNPIYVDLAAHHLAGTGVKTATVIGFPLGATLSAVKAAEAKEAVLRKADELDMVIHIGAVKAGLWEAVKADIEQVVAAADGAIVKVIIETGLLTDEEKRQACQAVIDGGAHFVKTSTGFGPGGATEEDIRLLKEVARDKIGIKASGGIRTREQALALVAAGATRLGTSAGIVIAGTDKPAVDGSKG